jgi:UDPglucose--hexose-1-phosphate uridylyltransferase
MNNLSLSDAPHRRYNILTGEWVLVSPHRTKRPWQGKVEKTPDERRPTYDPQCYLCPGNTRAGGHTNEDYTDPYVFTNDFAALLSDSPDGGYEEGLLRARGERGTCRVVCFSPNHALTIPEMDEGDISKIIGVWQHEYRSLGSQDFVNHVQIFENKGVIMGCSNPHPHGQIWAQTSVPQQVMKKTETQNDYYHQHGRSLLGDYLTQEIKLDERVVLTNDHFVALVPFWAVWPYEAMIVPRRTQADITELSPGEAGAFASIFKAFTIRLDNVFQTSFPYSMGIHQRPTDGHDHPGWHWHMSFYPPLLRSATVKKFMVGYEMFAEPQRDITAEAAARTLREVESTHYKSKP